MTTESTTIYTGTAKKKSGQSVKLIWILSSEIKNLKSEIRNKKSGIGNQKIRKSEIRKQKSEMRNPKSEMRNLKSEMRNPKPVLRRRELRGVGGGRGGEGRGEEVTCDAVVFQQ